MKVGNNSDARRAAIAATIFGLGAVLCKIAWSKRLDVTRRTNPTLSAVGIGSTGIFLTTASGVAALAAAGLAVNPSSEQGNTSIRKALTVGVALGIGAIGVGIASWWTAPIGPARFGQFLISGGLITMLGTASVGSFLTAAALAASQHFRGQPASQ